MADYDPRRADARSGEPRGKRTDRRVLIVTALLAAIALALFILYDGGFRTAPDDTSGGPDPQSSAPAGPEETQPSTQQQGQ